MESKVGIVVEFGEVVSDEHRAWAKANGFHLNRIIDRDPDGEYTGIAVAQCDPGVCWCGGAPIHS